MNTKVLGKWQKLCSRSEYCSSDVLRKVLKDVEGDEAAAREVVEALRSERYLDDSRFAAAFARDKSRLAGWGAVKIRFQLRAKGISDADIAAALEAVDPADAELKLRHLLAAKARTLQGDPQIRLKLLKFGLSRGYAYEACDAAVRTILSGGAASDADGLA